MVNTFLTRGGHLVAKRKLFAKNKNRFSDTLAEDIPPPTFWKTTAIILISCACIALYIGFESAMNDMLPKIDRYQDLQIHFGPIFHGAMEKQIQQIARDIDQDLAIAAFCLGFLLFGVVWDFVLIARRILIHAAWRYHATQ